MSKKKYEIMAILNKYKNILDNLISSSNRKSLNEPKFSNLLKLIIKKIRNVRRSGGISLSLSEKDCLDKNISTMLLGLAPKIQDFQIYKRYDVTSLSFMNEKAQDREGQKSKENEKDKRSKENRRGEKDKRSHCRKKINPMIRKSSGSKINVYHCIIY